MQWREDFTLLQSSCWEGRQEREESLRLHQNKSSNSLGKHRVPSISSSSKLSLSDDVTLPVREACNFSEIFLLNWGEGNWKSQVAGHRARCASLFSGQSRSARRRKEAVTVAAWWKRGSNEYPLCSGAFRGGGMRQELKGRGAIGQPEAKCSPP